MAMQEVRKISLQIETERNTWDLINFLSDKNWFNNPTINRLMKRLKRNLDENRSEIKLEGVLRPKYNQVEVDGFPMFYLCVPIDFGQFEDSEALVVNEDVADFIGAVSRLLDGNKRTPNGSLEELRVKSFRDMVQRNPEMDLAYQFKDWQMAHN